MSNKHLNRDGLRGISPKIIVSLFDVITGLSMRALV